GAGEDGGPGEGVTTYAPGRSATKPPSGSIVAPWPLTDQRTAEFLIAPPLASLAVAENRITSPVLALVVRGSIARPRTLLLTTSIITSPLTPSDFATTVALPGPRPLTTPAESTTGIEGLVEDHSIFTSSRGSPFAPIALALSL